MMIAAILSTMIVFPLAARSLGPVVEIIRPPITIERTAIEVVAMRRYFPMVASISLKFRFVPLSYVFSEGLRFDGSSKKPELVISSGPQEGFFSFAAFPPSGVVLAVFALGSTVASGFFSQSDLTTSVLVPAAFHVTASTLSLAAAVSISLTHLLPHCQPFLSIILSTVALLAGSEANVLAVLLLLRA